VAYAIFDTPAIHGILGIKDLAPAGSEMVPRLAIATAQLLQLLDDSSVHTAGHITVSSNLIIVGAGTSAGGHHPGLGLAGDRGPHR
jgi:Ethanolamine utilization protein EutJ (predicted chaperonin)